MGKAGDSGSESLGARQRTHSSTPPLLSWLPAIQAELALLFIGSPCLKSTAKSLTSVSKALGGEVCYLSCSNQSPAIWSSGFSTGAQQVPWSRCGPGVGLARTFAPSSFPSLLRSPGALSPLLSWPGTAVVQSCCASSQLGQHFLPSGSFQQQPAHYHTKHVPVSPHFFTRICAVEATVPAAWSWAWRMDFSANLMSKSQVQVEGRTELLPWGRSAKGDHPCRGGWGKPSLDPGFAAFLLGHCGCLSEPHSLLRARSWSFRHSFHCYEHK